MEVWPATLLTLLIAISWFSASAGSLPAMAMVNCDHLAVSDVILFVIPIVPSINPTEKLGHSRILGRTLALRHSKVRRSPYADTDGINSTYQAFYGDC